MMSTCCSEHVEARNKHIEKECIKFVINQNYVEMHGQQNIKYFNSLAPKTHFAITFKFQLIRRNKEI